MSMKAVFVAAVLAIAAISPGAAQADRLAEDMIVSILDQSANTATSTINAATTFKTLVTRAAVPTAVVQPDGTETVVFNCHGKCPKVTRSYNGTLAVPEHSCPRDALTALAQWRHHCDKTPHWKSYCWTRAPSVNRCCGNWVNKDDPAWQQFPSARVRKEIKVSAHHYEYEYPEKVDGDRRLIILPNSDNYNTHDGVCRQWRSANDAEFAFFMQNLASYGIQDADETGKVMNQEKWNPEGLGYFDKGGYQAVGA